MNKTMKVFMVLVLAGMFLLPPAAAMDTGSEAQSAAEPSAQPVVPAAATRHSGLINPYVREGDAPGVPALAPLDSLPREYQPLTTGHQSGSRGPRATPDIYPAAFSVVPPNPLMGWRNTLVVAAKNAVTQFNLTVNNSGDGDATSVAVTFTYFDVEDKQLDRSVQTGDIIAGSNATFYFLFKPAFCTYFYINITISVQGDLDPTDNALDLGYFAVTTWVDDCTVNNGWTGDLGTTKWHISDSPENDTHPDQHTAPNCWYAGRDAPVGTDGYDPNMDVSIKSQTIDLRNFGNQYFLMIDYQFHGSLPVLDAGDYFENYFSTDNGLTWSTARVHVDGPWIGAQGMVRFRENWLHWVTTVGTASITGLDITQYGGKVIQMKTRFVSNAANNDWGFFFDDFAVWGVEIYNDTRIDVPTDQADMRVNEKKDFDVKVTNLRQAQTTGFNCTFNITERGDRTHFLFGTPTVKTVGALGTGQSSNVQFSWTPAMTGDYIVGFNISGMPDQDRFNNEVERWVHVSGPNPRILVVDDDPFIGTPYYSTDAMLQTINETTTTAGDRPYADYGVYYTWWKGEHTYSDWGGDGPSSAIMAKYDAVIWLTGIDNATLTKNGSLTANDQANIKSYLANGGALWLSSMGAINDLGSNDFVRNTLHVDSARNDSLLKPTEDTQVLPSPVHGVPGSLAEGAYYYTSAHDGNRSYDLTDLIRPDASALGVLYGNLTPGDTWYVAIQYSGTTYRSVFQSFDFSMISFPNDRQNFAGRVLGYLMGGLGMEVYGQVGSSAYKQMVDPGQSVVFTLNITNSGVKEREVDNITVDAGPQGWTMAVDPDVKEGSPTTSIPQGDTLQITLTVTAPVKALAGERADLGINVTFKNYFQILFNRTVTEVNTIIKVELSALNTVQNVSGAGSVSFPFTLRNLGNLGVTADLLRTGEHFEWLMLSVPQVQLNAYEEKNLTAMMNVPEGAYRQAGNYTVTVALTSKAVYQDKSSNSTLNFTTNVRVAQLFGAKIDEVDPTDATPDMSAAKPSVKFTVTVSSAKGNGYDNVSVELKSKTFAPTTSTGGTGPSRSWDGAGWGLSSAGKVVDVTPFMTVGKQVSLTVFVPLNAEAGEFTIEVRATPGNGKTADGDSTTVTVKVTKPDLQFGGTVSFTPKEPPVGTPVKVKVTVKNLGGAKASGVDVGFYDSGSNLIETKTIPSDLASGATTTVEIEWSNFIEGENQITVRLDPDNKISEIAEDNNDIVETVVGQRSDLLFDGEPVFKVGGVVKASVKSGEQVQVAVTVKNSGTWSLNLTSVLVTMTDQLTGDVQTYTITSLPTRSDSPVTFTWVPKKDGLHTITINVSAPGISEKDTNNNEVTGSIKVSTPKTEEGTSTMMLVAIGGIIAVVVVIGLVLMMRRKKPAAPAYAPASAPHEEAVAVVAEEVMSPPPPPPPGPPMMR